MILRKNVVQGEQIGGEVEKYREYFALGIEEDGMLILLDEGLRIHDETERGDNETIKMGRRKVGAATGECCGGGR